MPTRPRRYRPPSPPDRRNLEAKRERDAFYTGAAWKRLRAAFLAGNPLCEPCLALDRLAPATIAHHRAERLAAPTRALEPSNLVAMCGSCHTAHHKASKARP